jgi:hypothetical protein
MQWPYEVEREPIGRQLPRTLWAQIAARPLRRVSTNLLLGCEPLGYLPLCEAVSNFSSLRAA